MRTVLFFLFFRVIHLSAQPFLPEEPFLCLEKKIKSIKINKDEVYSYSYKNHLIITKFIMNPSPAEYYHYHYYSDINEPDSIIMIEKWPDTAYSISTKIYYNYDLTGHLIKIEKFDNGDPPLKYVDSIVYNPNGLISSVFYFRSREKRVKLPKDTSAANRMNSKNELGNYFVPTTDLKSHKTISLPDMELYHQVTFVYDENNRVIREKYGYRYIDFVYAKNGLLLETIEFSTSPYDKDKNFTRSKFTYNKKGLVKKKQITRFHILTADGSQVVDDQVEFRYRYTFY